jgi:hypothetical protein
MLHVNYSILLQAACTSVSYFDCFYCLYCTHFSNVSLLCVSVSPTFALEQKKMGISIISLRLWHKFLTKWEGGWGGGGGGGQKSLIANIVALGKS